MMSGLRVNMSKSVIVGINSEEHKLNYFASLLGCEIGVWLLRYLGLPFGSNPVSLEFWELVVDRVMKRLDGWKRPFLSRGGRLILVLSVLGSIPNF